MIEYDDAPGPVSLSTPGLSSVGRQRQVSYSTAIEVNVDVDGRFGGP